MANLPEPYNSLVKFVREARKAEASTGLTAGQVLFGFSRHKGKLKLSSFAEETDRFLQSVGTYVEEFADIKIE